MNFSESLEKFIERGAKYQPSEGSYRNGCASLKPIVLKLESAIKEHHELWNQGGYCMAECAILCKALAEIEEMLK